jgi:hypothetical protein
MSIKNLIKSKGFYVLLAGCLFGAVFIYSLRWHIEILEIFTVPLFLVIVPATLFGIILAGNSGDIEKLTGDSVYVLGIITYGLLFLFIYKLSKLFLKKKNYNNTSGT